IKFSDDGTRIIRRELVRKIAAIRSFARYGKQRWTVPGLTPDKRNANPKLPRLFQDEADLRIVARDEYHIRLSRLQSGECRTKIGIPAGIALFANHCSRPADKSLLEKITQADAVVLFGVG